MASARPLRICFLWHQHQPDYRVGDAFFLPWVRLHAVKDYHDLCLILRRHPVRHTFNVVPSMLMQLDAYGKGLMDPLEALCRRPAELLTQEERRELAEWATTIQRDTMVRPLPRYDELFDALADGRWELFSVQDWRDVQVLVNLAWLGPVTRRTSPVAQELLARGRGFTHDDVLAVLDLHHEIMARVADTFAHGEHAGAFEISVTPYHHPILPLIINTDVMSEARPDAPRPDAPYRAPGHAVRHVRRALADWEQRTGRRPRGMWPAEGALSMEALRVLAAEGVRWTASDEDVLRASLGAGWDGTDLFFPHAVSTEAGEIRVLFRDHALSDAIGFSYASWEVHAAVSDMVRRLEERRTLIVRQHGEDALDSAVVPIMLDGENCWEFYRNNGEDFLDALCVALSDTDRFLSVTCSEATAGSAPRHLHHLRAGSWIDADMSVWIGDRVKNAAWSLLAAAKQALEASGKDAETVAATMETVEASDWFWWYDERHTAPHKPMFDAIFRRHLAAIFADCGVAPPYDLSRPLREVGMTSEPARIPVVFGTTSMHRSNALVRDVAIEQHNDWQRLTVRLERKPSESEEVVVQIIGQDGFERACLIACDELLWRSPHTDEGFEWFGEASVAFYLHAHRIWTVKVTEERVDGNQLSTIVHVAAP